MADRSVPCAYCGEPVCWFNRHSVLAPRLLTPSGVNPNSPEGPSYRFDLYHTKHWPQQKPARQAKEASDNAR